MPVEIQRGMNPEAIRALTQLTKDYPAAAVAQAPPPAPLGQLPVVSYGGGGPQPAAPGPQGMGGNPPRQMQLAARRQAEGWKQEYTVRQRQEIARINQARIAIWKDPNWSDSDKRAAIRLLDLQEYGINPTHMPPAPNEQQFLEGQGIGEVWRDEFGNVQTRDEKGVAHTQVTFDKTPEGIGQLHRNAMELQQQKYMASERDKRRTALMKWRTEEVDILKDGVKTTETRPHRPDELEGLSRSFFPELHQQEQEEMQKRVMDAQLRQELQRRVAAQQQEPQAVVPGQPPSGQEQRVESGWDAAPRELLGATHNLSLTKAEADLPGFVGKAQAFMREIVENEKRGMPTPAWKEPAYREAQAILAKYAARGGR